MEGRISTQRGRTSCRCLGLGHLPDFSLPGHQVWSWAPSLRACCGPTCSHR